MVVGNIGSIIKEFFDALARPSRFVAVQRTTYDVSRVSVLKQTWSLLVVYLLNLVLYAGPLTLAGIGTQFGSSLVSPAIIDFQYIAERPAPLFLTVAGFIATDPTELWRLLIGFARNSYFITLATGLTLAAFHGGVVLVSRTRGFVQSLHTVVYTTSAYLAGLFTGVWYLSTSDVAPAATEAVRNAQAAFFYWVFDLLAVDLVLPGIPPPDAVFTSPIGRIGALVVGALALLVFYYLYSLYLGARINHELGASSAFIVVIFVLVSPVAYIAGSIALTLALT